MLAIRVDAEDALRAERCEEHDGRHGEKDKGQPQPPNRPDDVEAVCDELGTEDGKRHDGVLDPGEHREGAEECESELGAARCGFYRADAGVHGAQNQWVRKRVGEHSRRVGAVRHRDCERRHGESQPARQRESLAKEVRRNGREGDECCVQSLCRAVRDDRVVRHQPHRRRHDRIEQRREMHARSADQRSAVLGEAPRQRRIDVLVGEVVRRQPPCRCDQPAAEAGRHDPGEPDPRGEGSEPRNRVEALSVRA